VVLSPRHGDAMDSPSCERQRAYLVAAAGIGHLGHRSTRLGLRRGAPRVTAHGSALRSRFPRCVDNRVQRLRRQTSGLGRPRRPARAPSAAAKPIAFKIRSSRHCRLQRQTAELRCLCGTCKSARGMPWGAAQCRGRTRCGRRDAPRAKRRGAARARRNRAEGTLQRGSENGGRRALRELHASAGL